METLQLKVFHGRVPPGNLTDLVQRLQGEANVFLATLDLRTVLDIRTVTTNLSRGLDTSVMYEIVIVYRS